MGPPPTPIDPNLESLSASPGPHLALDQLLLTSPGPQTRPFYPKEINLAASFYQEGQASSMRPNQLELNPSLNSHPDPWDSERVNRRMAQPQLMNQNYAQAQERSRQSGPLTYWGTNTTRSDVDSTTGRHVADSGYYTQTHGTASVFSADLASNQDCQSLAGRMTEAELSRDEMHFANMYPPEPSMDSSNGYPKEQQGEYSLDLVCQICQHRSKNKSDFTYVSFPAFLTNLD